MELTLKEAVEHLEDGIEVTLENGNYEYSIAPADEFLGGEGMDGYISEVLGNVAYDDAEDILNESIKYLVKDGSEVKITI